MGYKREDFTFTSSDGHSTVAAYTFIPDAVSFRGIIQLSHGMCDYVERYISLAEVLTDAGFIFCGNDHLGHGKTAPSPDALGYFGESHGEDLIVEDLHTMTLEMKKRYPDLPLILVGHSMGSFLARMYAIKYGSELSGIVILGTGGPNPALPAGKLITKVITLFRGKRYRSNFVKKLAFSGYNRKFEKNCRQNAWVTSDELVLDKYDADPLCSFTFTTSAYSALFRMVGRVNCRYWINNYPKELPTLIASGDMDPVGAFGKGPTLVAKWLKDERVQDVELKIYKGFRHELHNERSRDVFFADLLAWLDERYK